MTRQQMAGLVLAVALPIQASAAELGTAFTYQGTLQENGAPVTDTCDFRFGLWDAAAAGNEEGDSPQTINAVAVVGGVFTVSIDFGPDAINGTARWLRIEVQCPGDAGFVALDPRVELKPAPHALALPGLYTQQNATSPNLIGGSTRNDVDDGVVGAAIGGGGGSMLSEGNEITDNYGVIGGGFSNLAGDQDVDPTDAAFATVAGGDSNWAESLASTVSGGARNQAVNSFSLVCGGEENIALGAHSAVGGGFQNVANGSRAVVGGGSGNQANSSATVGGGASNEAIGVESTIAGGAGNATNAQHATVGGGSLNSASGLASTVGGGSGNRATDAAATVAGGMNNLASLAACTVGGGQNNVAGGLEAVVAGGNANDALGARSTVSGGFDNEAIAQNATVSGGTENLASGLNSTIPGGRLNEAGGTHSFAAGYRAKVRTSPQSGDADGDEGTFVWADSVDADFTSTAANQFLIRSAGGVGINTNAPTAPLHVLGGIDTEPDSGGVLVVGHVTAANLSMDGNEIMARNNGAVAPLSLNADGGNVILCSSTDGRVGIGDSTPDARLDVTEAGVVAGFNRIGSDGTIVNFQQDNITEGSVMVSGNTVLYVGFTGAHYAWTEDTIPRGTLVVMTGENRRRRDDAGAEPYYGIAASTVANDPKCLGAYMGLLDPAQPVSLDNAHQVMAVGNGDMWVVDSGRNIQPGDYLISSDTPGHAMLDDAERFPVGHVIARAGEPVDWSTVTDTVEARKHKRISIFFESFERGGAVELGKIVEAQQMRIEELTRRLSDLETKRQRSSLALIGALGIGFGVTTLGRRALRRQSNEGGAL